MFLKKIKENYKTLIYIALINLIIFGVANLIFDIKYEQVDDFIIYNLYSGLDGTYNIHGIYIHPLICFIISLFFRIIPMVNWHTIFLLLMQFICFTIIGTLIIRKNNSKLSYILYVLFASVFYTSLLELIQYTSVAALLILTAFFIMMDYIDRDKRGKKYIFCYILLFTIGIMTRMQSLMIIAPFFALYFVYNLVIIIRKRIDKQKILKIIKHYLVFFVLTILVYVSNYIIYNSDHIYKNYMEYNDIRAILHDMSYTSYAGNKEIFDEIGWSENDHYLFYTFNFGDENVYSKENLQKIIDYKKSKGDLYNYDIDLENIVNSLIEQLKNNYSYIAIMFVGSFLIAIYTNKEKRGYIISIFLVTLAVNSIFIIVGRSMQRVVIPEYIIGTAMFLYLTKYEKQYIEKTNLIKAMSIFIIVATVIFAGGAYEFGYELKDYSNYKNVINYTNSHKENVYLYTVPSLQYRYLVYSVYEMPPIGAFSNLRVMGGWDMFTKNYYDFKERYNLDGTFLDLLKNNVYLVDGDVTWSGNYYHNYIDNIVLFIKENYNKDVNYEKVETFDNIYIYKLYEIVE